MTIDSGDFTWAIGYTVGGIIGAGGVASGVSVGWVIASILLGVLFYLFLSHAEGM